MNIAHNSQLLVVVAACSLALLSAGCSPGGFGPGADAAQDVEGPPCNTSGDCEDGWSCCAEVCVDTAVDPDNCGGCGIDCSENDGFCSADASCSALSWNALCANAEIIGLRDGNPPDDATTDLIRENIAAYCAMASRSASATDASLVGGDGRPLVRSGTTLVAGGGGFFQPVIRYVDQQGATGVYFDQIDNGNTSRIVRRDNGQVLATVPSTTTGEDEDWFTVYLVEVPESGALLVAAYGFVENGTTAAGLWANANVLNNPSGYGDTWFVVKWNDTDALDGPTATDTYDVIAQGR